MISMNSVRLARDIDEDVKHQFDTYVKAADLNSHVTLQAIIQHTLSNISSNHESIVKIHNDILAKRATNGGKASVIAALNDVMNKKPEPTQSKNHNTPKQTSKTE